MHNIKLEKLNLRKRTLGVLKSNHFKDLEDLSKSCEFDLNTLNESNVSDFVGRFTKSANLKGFGKVSRFDLEVGIKEFISESTQSEKYLFFELYKKELMSCKKEEIDDDDEYEDYEEDLGYPVKSLFINTLPVKGIDSLNLLEDVLQELEELVLEEHEVEYLNEIPYGEGLKQLAALVELNEWLGDSPIYISQEASKIYTDVVVVLTKKATVVLKGI